MNRNDTTTAPGPMAAQAFIAKQREVILAQSGQGTATAAGPMATTFEPRKPTSPLRQHGHQTDARPARPAPSILGRIRRFLGAVGDLLHACYVYDPSDYQPERCKPSASRDNVKPPALNTTERQRAAILQRLMQGPATVEQLMHDCHAPDPRKRISELRRGGHEIDTQSVERPKDDGTVNRVQVYVLRAMNTRKQGGAT